MVFQCINIRQVPWEVLKTAAFGLGFQHLPRDLANVYAWKTMFALYINHTYNVQSTLFIPTLDTMTKFINDNLNVMKYSLKRWRLMRNYAKNIA